MSVSHHGKSPSPGTGSSGSDKKNEDEIALSDLKYSKVKFNDIQPGMIVLERTPEDVARTQEIYLERRTNENHSEDRIRTARNQRIFRKHRHLVYRKDLNFLNCIGIASFSHGTSPKDHTSKWAGMTPIYPTASIEGQHKPIELKFGELKVVYENCWSLPSEIVKIDRQECYETVLETSFKDDKERERVEGIAIEKDKVVRRDARVIKYKEGSETVGTSIGTAGTQATKDPQSETPEPKEASGSRETSTGGHASRGRGRSGGNALRGGLRRGTDRHTDIMKMGSWRK